MEAATLELSKAAFGAEAEAILATGENMDWAAFEKAVELLSKAGRIATSGCGHSGIACSHFAHSMCCIERPARFIPPSEAVHGAIGFLQPGDVLTLASRGGKTTELLPIANIAKEKDAFVITITENIESKIARLSDIVLPMKVPREIDPYDSQGTSSFVALCSVFDALQAAVMEETGFCNEQFAIIHPGGAVGEKLNK